MDVPASPATKLPITDAPPQRPDGPSTFLVVTTETCPWCTRTMEFLKALHEERGDFQVASLDANAQPDAFRQVQAHTRRATVPQIFLDGRFVGGWNDLAAAAKRGQLDAYLDGEEWALPTEAQGPKRRWFRRRG